MIRFEEICEAVEQFFRFIGNKFFKNTGNGTDE